MAKKLEVVNPKPVSDLTEADLALAKYLEVDLDADVHTHFDRIQKDAQTGFKAALSMGLRLVAAKSQCQHGEFLELLEQTTVSERDAQSCMRLAKAFASEGDARRREALIGLGKTKAVALLSQKPDVREQIMDSPELMAQALDGSKREFEGQLAKLRAQLVQAQMDTDAAQAEAALAKKQLKRRAEKDEDEIVPLAVADLRAELAALVRKGQLAADSVHTLGKEVADLAATAPEWATPTARLAVSGLLALREQVDGTIKAYMDVLGEDAKSLKKDAPSMAYLAPAEQAAVAADWQRLTAMHQHEALLREYERKQTRPKAKGRPMAEPVAPDSAAAKKTKKA